MMAVVSMALVLTGCSLLPDADVIRAMIKQDASYWTNQEQKSCGRLSEESIYQDDVFSQWGGDGIIPQCDVKDVTHCAVHYGMAGFREDV